jgi:hypothetical protein
VHHESDFVGIVGTDYDLDNLAFKKAGQKSARSSRHTVRQRVLRLKDWSRVCAGALWWWSAFFGTEAVIACLICGSAPQRRRNEAGAFWGAFVDPRATNGAGVVSHA